MSETIEQNAAEENSQSVAKIDKNIENSAETKEELEDIKIDSKKWLYAFYSKLNGENKKFYILKPNRKLRQEGELEYAKQLAKFVKAGLLPKAAWGTILDNSGGTISESEAQSYTQAKNTFFELSLELNKLQQQESNEERNKKVEDLMLDIEIVKNKIQSFELEQIYIFENTAEAKARNATIEWWLCKLSTCENEVLFFEGKNIEEQLDWYDSLDPNKEEEFEKIKIGQKFSYLITLWYLNKISSFEEFKEADLSKNK